MSDTDIATEQLKHAGWNIGDNNGVELTDCHKFYLCQPEDDELYKLIAVPIDTFNDIRSDVPIKTLVEGVRTGLMAYRVGKGDLNNTAGVLAAYFKASETFKQAVAEVGYSASMNIVINLYGKVGSPTLALRPAVISVQKCIEHFNDVKSISKELLDYDREVNPDFFSTI